MAAWVSGRELARRPDQGRASPRHARESRRADARRRGVPQPRHPQPARRGARLPAVAARRARRRPRPRPADPPARRRSSARSATISRSPRSRSRSNPTTPAVSSRSCASTPAACASATRCLNATRGQLEQVGRLVRMFANHREDIRAIESRHDRRDRRRRQRLEDRAPATRSAIRARRSSSITIAIPNTVINVVVEPETDEDAAKLRRRARAPRDRGPVVPRQDRSPSPARSCSPAWASSTSRSWSTACAASSASRRASASRRSRIARPSRAAPRARTSSSASPRARRPARRVRPRPARRRADRSGRRLRLRESRIRQPTSRREHAPAVAAGVAEAVERGVLAGYPMTDLRVQVVGGSYHPVDSNNYAFKVAGGEGVRRGRQQGRPDHARAGHGARGRDSRRIRRRRARRFACQTRKSRWNYRTTWCTDRRLFCPDGLDVRLRDRPAVPHPRPRHVLDGARPLR